MPTKEEIRSAADLRKLNVKDLNQLLKKHGLNTKGKDKGHKLSQLCDKLGFKHESGSFQDVVTQLQTTKTGWVKDLRKCPPVTLAVVTDYLLKAHSTEINTDSGDLESFTTENLRRYKTLRSYELYKAKHIHSMACNPMPDSEFCALRSKCNPSWDTSGKMYDCIVVFEKGSEKPVGSSCTCTAGQGEACTHVAGLLFALEDFTSMGYHELPDDPASTEILCAWVAPRDSKVCTHLLLFAVNLFVLTDIYYLH